jgi:hypothetical protein
MPHCTELEVLRARNLHLVHKPAYFVNNDSTSKDPPLPETWHLPRLHTLSITHSSFVDDKTSFMPISSLLNPVSLPSLKSLSIAYGINTSEPEFLALAPQLTHLWLRRLPSSVRRSSNEPPASTIPELPSIDLSHCSRNLVHLAVDLRTATDLEALRALGSLSVTQQPVEPLEGSGRGGDQAEGGAVSPVTPVAAEPCYLRTLRIESPLLTRAETVLFNLNPPPIEALHALLVADVSDLPAEQVISECEAREVVRAECEKRAIKLEEWEFAPTEHMTVPEKRIGGQEEKWEQEKWRFWCDEQDREVDELEEQWKREDEEVKAELEASEVAEAAADEVVFVEAAEAATPEEVILEWAGGVVRSLSPVLSLCHTRYPLCA